jgi:hypothetical protein
MRRRELIAMIEGAAATHLALPQPFLDRADEVVE